MLPATTTLSRSCFGRIDFLFFIRAYFTWQLVFLVFLVYYHYENFTFFITSLFLWAYLHCPYHIDDSADISYLKQDRYMFQFKKRVVEYTKVENKLQANQTQQRTMLVYIDLSLLSSLDIISSNLSKEKKGTRQHLHSITCSNFGNCTSSIAQPISLNRSSFISNISEFWISIIFWWTQRPVNVAVNIL